MKDLPSGFESGAAATITAPGYFVQIDFSSPLRLSSRVGPGVGGAFTWNGLLWQPWDMTVQGLAADGSQSSVGGTLDLGNTDNTIAAYVLIEGGNRPIQVWAFYGDANPAPFDVVCLFSGRGDECDIDPNSNRVRITLQQEGGQSLYCPRLYFTKELGLNFLPPAGTIIDWGGEKYILEADNG